MVRIPRKTETTVINEVLRDLPVGFRRRLGHIPFFINGCPNHAGFSPYKELGDGRLCIDTPHVLYKRHQHHLPKSKREDTIILQGKGIIDKYIILHEIGHILHARLHFTKHKIKPLTEYAGENYYEAFATSFQSYNTEEIDEDKLWGFRRRRDLRLKDPATFTLFEKLCK